MCDQRETYPRPCQQCRLDTPYADLRNSIAGTEDEPNRILSRCPVCHNTARAYEWRRMAERSLFIPIAGPVFLGILSEANTDPFRMIAATFLPFLALTVFSGSFCTIASAICEMKAKKYNHGIR